METGALSRLTVRRNKAVVILDNFLTDGKPYPEPLMAVEWTSR